MIKYIFKGTPPKSDALEQEWYSFDERFENGYTSIERIKKDVFWDKFEKENTLDNSIKTFEERFLNTRQ